MEQIKRMLVNQRGFIVQALKQMTEANTANREVREKFVDQIKVCTALTLDLLAPDPFRIMGGCLRKL